MPFTNGTDGKARARKSKIADIPVPVLTRPTGSTTPVTAVVLGESVEVTVGQLLKSAVADFIGNING